MKQDQLYLDGTIAQDFTFNEKVADVFDDMVSRSVPFYQTVISSIAALLKDRLPPGTTVYDLGCSTGSTLLQLSRLLERKDITYVGIDNASPMIEKAQLKSEHFSKSNIITFDTNDITTCPLPNAGAVICNYTMQFLRPLNRQGFLQRIYDLLPDGGILTISEKIISTAPQLNRDFIAIYHQFKKEQGYSELEIAAKREALENILIPFSQQENIEMLKKAGFKEVDTFLKWFNFCSFTAIK